MDNDSLIAIIEQIKILSEKALAAAGGKPNSRSRAKKEPKDKNRNGPLTLATADPLSFSLNARAFMNKYGKGLSGPQKFTLLIARMSKGKTNEEFSSEYIASEWNRMKQIMGGPFNAAYATRAKERGWIDAPRRGFYVIAGSWKEALG